MIDARERTISSDLVCPDCGTELLRGGAGELRCLQCGEFPVLGGNVPVLLPRQLMPQKTEIMEWWSRHNMDLNWRTPHLEFEKGTWEYFRETDRRWFMWTRPFLHVRYPLLHKVIDMKRLAGKRVLDVGCGVGTMFEQLSALGADVTSIDLAPQHAMLTAARARLFNLKGRVFQADAERLPFAGESFDFVYSWGVLHHTLNTAQAINEIHRVLRPSGEVFLMVYHRHSVHYWYNKMFKWGVLRLKFLTMNAQQIANRSSDGVLYGGNPLSQYFSLAEMRRMLDKFVDVRLMLTGHADTIRNLPVKSIPLGKVVPVRLAERVMRRLGHLMIITGRKP